MRVELLVRVICNPYCVKCKECGADKYSRCWDPETGTDLHIFRPHVSRVEHAFFHWRGARIETRRM